jgi:hypothetical protein
MGDFQRQGGFDMCAALQAAGRGGAGVVCRSLRWGAVLRYAAGSGSSPPGFRRCGGTLPYWRRWCCS